MSNDTYTPIACGVYDLYEIAIMQGRLLTLDTQQGRIRVRPVALKIEGGAEYLEYDLLESPVAEQARHRLRLDKIHHVAFTD